MKKVLLVLWFAVSGLYAQNFTDVTGSLPQLQNGISAWGDYDGDGDLDLFFTGRNPVNNHIEGGLFENNSGVFTLLNGTGLPLVELGEADWADVDNDGDLDLLISGTDEPGYVFSDVYINTGSGVFSALNAGFVQVYLGDAHFVDINNDGNPDVALTGFDWASTTDVVKIYKNNGDLTFTDLAVGFPPLSMANMDFADYDNDGFTDLIINGWDDNNSVPYTHIWKNNGDETFSEQNFGLAQLWLGDLQWMDANGDGNMDVIVTGTPSSESEIHLYLGSGTGFTEDPSFNFTSVHLSEVEKGDFNHDGYPDLFITGGHVDATESYNVSMLLLNDGTGQFGLYTGTSFPAITYGDADAADFDGNGWDDLIISGSDENGSVVAKIYKNSANTAIEHLKTDLTQAYPNPVRQELFIHAKTSRDLNYKLFDLDGKVMGKGVIQNGETRISFYNLPDGMYIIQISTDGKEQVLKIIKK